MDLIVFVGIHCIIVILCILCKILMLRIYQTRSFSKWAKKENIGVASLVEVVKQLEQGMSCVHLGSGLIKERVKRADQGASGAYRFLLAVKQAEKYFFLTWRLQESKSCDELLV